MEVKQNNRNQPYRFHFVQGTTSMMYEISFFKPEEPSSTAFDIPAACKQAPI